MKEETTVGTVANFPVENITHKPKRMQGDIIRQKNEEDTAPQRGRSSSSSMNASGTLSVITLERAVPFYEELAVQDPVNAKLFIATSKWLKELLVTRSTKIEAAVKATFAKEEDTNDSTEN
jgi:hypothetical protein